MSRTINLSCPCRLIRFEGLTQSRKELIFSRYGLPHTDMITDGKNHPETDLLLCISETGFVHQTDFQTKECHNLETDHRLSHETLSPMTEIGKKNGNERCRTQTPDKAFAAYLEYHRITGIRPLSRSQFYAKLRQLSEHHGQNADMHQPFACSNM